MAKRILIAGIGNIFLGDDAFGVEVAQRMMQRDQPEGVVVRDFGIRGLDLTYKLLEEWDAAILVDAAPRGYRTGTIFTIEPDPAVAVTSNEDIEPGDLLIDSHSMDPVRVLRLVATLGGNLKRLYLVGCEPTPIGSEDDMQMCMSAPVAKAVDEAIKMIDSLVTKIRGEGTGDTVFSDQFLGLIKGDVTHGQLSPSA